MTTTFLIASRRVVT